MAGALALMLPTAGRADFMWLAPTWTANQFDVIGGPGATAQTSFGPKTADVADAGGMISATSDPNTLNSGGFLMVTFSRSFQLFNDPNDSDVTLFGVLSGLLNTTSAAPAIAASTDALGEAAIYDVPGGNSFNSVTAVANAIAINDTDNVGVLDPQESSMVLADGVYTISGSLMINLRVNQAGVGIGDANADINWLVGLTAVSIVPEPASYLLLGAEVSLLAWLRWRRKSAHKRS